MGAPPVTGRPGLLLLLRWVVGGLFITAGLLKALDPARFTADILAYRLLPYAPAVALAFYAPYLELIAGARLVLRPRDDAARQVLAGLTLLWTAAVATAWMRGLDISCGCFGAGAGATAGLALARNVLLLFALAALRRPS